MTTHILGSTSMLLPKKMLCEEHGIKMFYITKKNYSLGEVLKYINETSNKKK
jgi:hypothetical protein